MTNTTKTMQNEDIFIKAKEAGKALALVTDEAKNGVLCAVADEIGARKEELLAANAADLGRMERANPLYDRLMLTPDRLDGIARDIRHVASLPSPLGIESKRRTLPNGLRLRRVSVPFGVIGVVYEARPTAPLLASYTTCCAAQACAPRPWSASCRPPTRPRQSCFRPWATLTCAYRGAARA